MLRSSEGMKDHEWVHSTMQRASESAINLIFRKIKLVNPYGKNLVLENLKNLHCGPIYVAPYTFDHEHDLAIISLDQRESDSHFVDKLIEIGYEPIPSAYLSKNSPSDEGADVFTVGYPVSVSEYNKIDKLPKEMEDLVSKFISIPAFAFGKVSQLRADLYYFWVDMSIYSGNSGSPVIEDNKIVGIVIEQAGAPSFTDSNIEFGIPFGVITKSEYVWDLIEKQEIRDLLVEKEREATVMMGKGLLEKSIKERSELMKKLI